MATTTKHALRYPVGADSADVPRDIQNLANDVDGKMAEYTEGAIGSRPAVGTSGRWFREEGGAGLLYLDDGEEWVDVLTYPDTRIVHTDDPRLIPPGVLAPYVGAAAPTGWLLCDGASYLRTDYANLFNALGGVASPFGLPDGTHFNVPDLQGRSVVGAGTAAGAAGATLKSRGAKGGEEKHTLTVAELASHAHTNGRDTWNGGTVGSHNVYALDSRSDFAVFDSSQAAGGNAAHNVMHPFQVLPFIVKT